MGGGFIQCLKIFKIFIDRKDRIWKKRKRSRKGEGGYIGQYVVNMLKVCDAFAQKQPCGILSFVQVYTIKNKNSGEIFKKNF